MLKYFFAPRMVQTEWDEPIPRTPLIGARLEVDNAIALEAPGLMHQDLAGPLGLNIR